MLISQTGMIYSYPLPLFHEILDYPPSPLLMLSPGPALLISAPTILLVIGNKMRPFKCTP